MATVVWWLFRQTINVSPWVERSQADGISANGEFSLPPVKVGLGVFLAVATSLFALLISAYFMRMAGADWTTLAVPDGLWLNTGVLVLSSAAMHWTRTAAKRGALGGVRFGLIAAGFFTFVFLAGQLWIWQQLSASGYFLTSNPANAFFYLFTAVHGVHLLGGLWVWARATVKVWRGGELGAARLSVELCTVYWHYLLLVWLVLFTLLVTTPPRQNSCGPDNFAVCGPTR